MRFCFIIIFRSQCCIRTNRKDGFVKVMLTLKTAV